MIQQYINIRQAGGGVAVGVSDATPDFGDTITITATATGFVPTQYQFLLFNGSVTLLAQQVGNALNWTVNVFTGNYDIYVLATDGTGTAFSSTPIAITSLLLDAFPTTGAGYSIRKIRTNYTGAAIRVRRSSDNTEQDIGFVGEDLDTAALLTFAGAGSAFVTTWYDQGGNGLNVTQPTAARQPRIVDSGVLETMNGKAGIRFVRTSQHFLNGGNILSADSNPLMLFVVAEIVANGYVVAKSLAGAQVGRYAMGSFDSSTAAVVMQNTATTLTPTTPLAGGQRAWSLQYVYSGGLLFHRNDALVASDTTSNVTIGVNPRRFLIGAYNNSNDTAELGYHNSHIQEVIVYFTDYSAQRATITAEQMTYYGI